MTTLDDRRRIIERLHRQYGGVIFDLCLRILADRSLAEDAVQETYVNAFRFLPSFHGNQGHLAWLYRIGTNVCLKLLRTARRKGTELIDHPENIEREKSDPVYTIHYRRILARLLDELDERAQIILYEYYFAGMNQGEIAESLGISRRAVVKRLDKLRRRTADLLKEESENG